MSKAWYHKYIESRIREVWGWSPARKAALKRALWPGTKDRWGCEECGAGPLRQKEREVDHLIPVNSVEGWDGWGPLISRALDAPAELLAVVCKDCHTKKSVGENAERRKSKDGPTK